MKLRIRPRQLPTVPHLSPFFLIDALQGVTLQQFPNLEWILALCILQFLYRFQLGNRQGLAVLTQLQVTLIIIILVAFRINLIIVFEAFYSVLL